MPPGRSFLAPPRNSPPDLLRRLPASRVCPSPPSHPHEPLAPQSALAIPCNGDALDIHHIRWAGLRQTTLLSRWPPRFRPTLAAVAHHSDSGLRRGKGAALGYRPLRRLRLAHEIRGTTGSSRRAGLGFRPRHSRTCLLLPMMGIFALSFDRAAKLYRYTVRVRGPPWRGSLPRYQRNIPSLKLFALRLACCLRGRATPRRAPKRASSSGKICLSCGSVLANCPLRRG